VNTTSDQARNLIAMVPQVNRNCTSSGSTSPAFDSPKALPWTSISPAGTQEWSGLLVQVRRCLTPGATLPL